jgi:Toxin PAAR-like domain
MSHEVYADGMAIAGKAGQNKSIARFPDVCMSPPSPPAGPIPVPYPNTSLSGDLKEGSTTVKLGGQPAALAQQSYYQPSALGDEAATKAWGMNIVTHQITGKTYFQAWSMDVKIEGKNVCRHVDITTSNHASDGTTTVPAPTGESQTLALIKEGKCPCCEKPLHPNQVNEKGEPHPLIKEDDYYKKGVATMQSKLDSIPGDIAAKLPYTLDPAKLTKVQEGTAKQLKDAQDAQATVANSRNIDPPCENVHNPKDEKCGAHFDASRSVTSLGPEGMERKKRYNTARESVLGFTDHVKTECRDLWRSKGKTIGKSSPVNHMTPLEAGGCPTDQKNLVPSDALSDECKKVDAAQTKLQEIGERAW